MIEREYDALIEAALAEDLDEAGDVTSQAVFSGERAEARLVSKDTGVLAGLFLFRRVFEKVDAGTEVTFLKEEGSGLSPGDEVALVKGEALSLLTAERTALNFLSLLSGIASAARSYAEEAGRGGAARILDTRKTIPGFRALSKYAVRVGGAVNHRMGLHDMVLIKDNHIDMCGSITRAVERVREKWRDRFRIEVECRTLQDVKEAAAAGVDVIMLDNMDPGRIAEALRMKRGEVKFEVSGNVDLSAVRDLSAAGVDFISVGKLTHSVRSFDFSLQTARSGRG